MLSWRLRHHRGDVQPFRFLGRSFKQSVHIFAPGLKSSRNHQRLRAAKFNQVRLEGEPHNPSGLVFAVGVVNARDELTQRQRLLLVIDLHGLNIGQETARALWGVTLWGISPPENRCQHGCFMARVQPTRTARFRGVQFMGYAGFESCSDVSELRCSLLPLVLVLVSAGGFHVWLRRESSPERPKGWRSNRACFHR
jgi:hypothetical protein